MSNKFIIKDAGGNQINFIVADEDFVKANYSNYEMWVDPQAENTKAEAARFWRNRELARTDYILPLTDHPELDAYKTYRTELRDWPSTSDFPDTRPTLT
jgi:hypothetical protein